MWWPEKAEHFKTVSHAALNLQNFLSSELIFNHLFFIFEHLRLQKNAVISFLLLSWSTSKKYFDHDYQLDMELEAEEIFSIEDLGNCLI